MLRYLNINKKSYLKGKNLRQNNTSIDHLKRGNAARIHINPNIKNNP